MITAWYQLTSACAMKQADNASVRAPVGDRRKRIRVAATNGIHWKESTCRCPIWWILKNRKAQKMPAQKPA